MKDELIGLTEVEELVIKCGDCGTPLAEVVLSETNDSRVSRGLQPQKSKFKVTECTKCGGSSFETKVFEGTTVVGGVKDGTGLEDIDTYVQDGVIVTVFKVR